MIRGFKVSVSSNVTTTFCPKFFSCDLQRYTLPNNKDFLGSHYMYQLDMVVNRLEIYLWEVPS